MDPVQPSRIITGPVGILFFFGVVLIWLGTGYGQYRSVCRDVALAGQEATRLEQVAATLEAEYVAWQQDTAVIEKAIREELLMSRPEEFLFYTLPARADGAMAGSWRLTELQAVHGGVGADATNAAVCERPLVGASGSTVRI